MTFTWNNENEQELLRLKDMEKLPYRVIADKLGTTLSSVKHKYVRLNQANNDDKHHHPVEKIEQIYRVLNNSNLKILETNAGWGNLSKVYHMYGEVLAHDIDKEKVDHLNGLNLEEFDAVKCDSFKELHRYVWAGLKFDVVDLDPYGFPSRYFPHVFQLIHDGYLFVTFPKMGVQQINKIMVEHYRVFWGISLDDKDIYEEIIHRKVSDYGLQYYRTVQLIDSLDLGRMHRFVYKVKKESALDIVGLKVNRKQKEETK